MTILQSHEESVSDEDAVAVGSIGLFVGICGLSSGLAISRTHIDRSEPRIILHGDTDCNLSLCSSSVPLVLDRAGCPTGAIYVASTVFLYGNLSKYVYPGKYRRGWLPVCDVASKWAKLLYPIGTFS